MDSVSDLLERIPRPQEPSEIVRLKQFIQLQFNASAKIAIQGDALVITVSSAALANTLRLRITQLQSTAQTTRRLIFRIQ